jgi:hypothetical protein
MKESIYYRIYPKPGIGYMRCGSEYIDIALIEAGIFATEEELRKSNPKWAPGKSYVFHIDREIEQGKRNAVVEALKKCDCGDIEFEKTFR